MAKNVVIVDDPATMRQILGRDCRAGIDVAEAAEGRVDAGATFAAPAFDLILSDVDLANRNGAVRC